VGEEDEDTQEADGFSLSWTILKLSMPKSMFLRVTPTLVEKGQYGQRLLQPSFPFTLAFALEENSIVTYDTKLSDKDSK
jgi:hypothetical protein